MPRQTGRKLSRGIVQQRLRIFELCLKAEHLGSERAWFIFGDVNVKYIEEGNIDDLEIEAMFEILFSGGFIK